MKILKEFYSSLSKDVKVGKELKLQEIDNKKILQICGVKMLLETKKTKVGLLEISKTHERKSERIFASFDFNSLEALDNASQFFDELDLDVVYKEVNT